MDDGWHFNMGVCTTYSYGIGRRVPSYLLFIYFIHSGYTETGVLVYQEFCFWFCIDSDSILCFFLGHYSSTARFPSQLGIRESGL